MGSEPTNLAQRALASPGRRKYLSHSAADQYPVNTGEASAIARQMTDPKAIEIMRHIVRGYEILAENAKKRALRNKSLDRNPG